MPVSAQRALQAFEEAGYGMLAIGPDHVFALETLPALHEDPFDRMLVAQALNEPLRLVTADSAMARYSGRVVLVWRRGAGAIPSFEVRGFRLPCSPRVGGGVAVAASQHRSAMLRLARCAGVAHPFMSPRALGTSAAPGSRRRANSRRRLRRPVASSSAGHSSATTRARQAAAAQQQRPQGLGLPDRRRQRCAAAAAASACHGCAKTWVCHCRPRRSSTKRSP
jgi:hypothetical protein